MAQARPRKHPLLLTLLCIAALVSCNRDDGAGAGADADAATPAPTSAPTPLPNIPGKQPTVAVTSAALVSLPSCDDVDGAARTAAKRALAKLMSDKRDEVVEALEAGDCWVYSGGWADAGAAFAAEDGVSGTSSSSGSGPSKPPIRATSRTSKVCSCRSST